MKDKRPQMPLPQIQPVTYGTVEVGGRRVHCGVRILTIEESRKFDFPYDPDELRYQSIHDKTANVRIVAENLLDIYNRGGKLSTCPDTKPFNAVAPGNLPPPRNAAPSDQTVVFHCGDIVSYAQRVVARNPGKKVAILNPANRKRAFGGLFLGANALEEIYGRCSDLAVAYAKHAQMDGFHYTLSEFNQNQALANYDIEMGKGEAWYTPDITFYQKPPVVRGAPYVKLDKPFQVSVIGSTAPDYKSPEAAKADPDNEAIIKNEIRAQCTAARMMGVEIPIFTAFGCGAFNNDPALVARYYFEVLYLEGYAKGFDHVDFAIWQDPNPQMPQNFSVFRSVFTDLAEKIQQKIKIENYTLQAEMMQFHNNFLMDTTGIKPQTSLTEEQQSWLPVMNECQKTTKIYTNKQYADKIDKSFNRPGNYPLAAYPSVKQSNRDVVDENVAEVLKQKNVYAPEQSNEVAYNRQYTKYRVIYSEVPFITPDGLKKRKMITACAPNFMGSSPYDVHMYLQDGKLNVKNYTVACNELATLILFAAKDNKLDSLDIAEFGLGAYLKVFKDNPLEAEKARKIMYTAFARAAKFYDLKVNWLLWEGANGAQERAVQLNTTYNSPYLTFKTGNILDSENSLNNGSDRTICGKMNHSNPGTTEEKVAQNSMLMEIQTELNPSFYNQQIAVDVTEGMKKIDIENSGKISLGSEYVKVEYENQKDALNFAAYLLEKGIHGAKNQNTPVTVNQRNNKFFVRLDEKSFNKFMKDDSAYKQLSEKTNHMDALLKDFMKTHGLEKNHENLKKLPLGKKAYVLDNKKYYIAEDLHTVLQILHNDIPDQQRNTEEKIEAIAAAMKDTPNRFFDAGPTLAMKKNAKELYQQYMFLLDAKYEEQPVGELGNNP